MKKKTLVTRVAAMFAATALLWLGPATNAQSAQAQESSRAQNSDVTREELALFDQFLDNHREIAEQLRKDPSLVKNGEFLQNHPALQTYLQQHPGIREELREDPKAFMRKENRYDRREDGRNGDITRSELASFDRFLDSHRETAEQIRKDPSLAKNQEFLNKNPDLQTYLQEHPAVREEINENPNVVMGAENRYDRQEDARNNDADRDRDDRARDRDRDVTPRDRDDRARDRDRDATPRDRDATRGELASFDQFLDHHRETAEQLRKDPSLIKNQQFVSNHPALQSYLQAHNDVREELNENPNAFMRAENRYDQREDARNGDHDFDRDHAASFGKFLNGHSEISAQLSKNPSLFKNKEYLENHPELREYLRANPGVQSELSHHSQSFIKAAQEFHTDTYNKDIKATTPPPTSETKPPEL